MNSTTHKLLEQSNTSYHAQVAIIVYTTKEKDYYLESRSIDHKGQMGAGVPLSKACIAEIAKSFSEEQSSTPHGLIPPSMLYADNRFGHQKYIWYNPPQKRQMYFAKQLEIPDGIYHVPGILYVTNGTHLHLYAFKGNRPKLEQGAKKDTLYQAPFFNTTKGSVCLGVAKLDYPNNPSYQDLIDYWEKRFWLTEFTHLGGSENPTKSNLVRVTKNSADCFDLDELLPSTITLKGLL